MIHTVRSRTHSKQTYLLRFIHSLSPFHQVHKKNVSTRWILCIKTVDQSVKHVCSTLLRYWRFEICSGLLKSNFKLLRRGLKLIGQDSQFLLSFLISITCDRCFDTCLKLEVASLSFHYTPQILLIHMLYTPYPISHISAKKSFGTLSGEHAHWQKVYFDRSNPLRYLKDIIYLWHAFRKTVTKRACHYTW